jgi:hypothetical protein
MEHISLNSYANNETGGIVPNIMVFEYLPLPIVEL